MVNELTLEEFIKALQKLIDYNGLSPNAIVRAYDVGEEKMKPVVRFICCHRHVDLRTDKNPLREDKR